LVFWALFLLFALFLVWLVALVLFLAALVFAVLAERLAATFAPPLALAGVVLAARFAGIVLLEAVLVLPPRLLFVAARAVLRGAAIDFPWLVAARFFFFMPLPLSILDS
jgi:hypothetical protein